MFCSYCRSPNPDDGVYCTGCGRDLKTQRTPTPLPPAGGAAPPTPDFSATTPPPMVGSSRIGMQTVPYRAPVASSTLAEGTVVAERFRIEAKLGEGGMGAVYRAKDTRLNRVVAIKFVLGISLDALARFQAEAQTIAKLEHKNIVAVYDWLPTTDSGPCLVMQYVEGESLYDRLHRERKLDLKGAMEVLLPVCEGLIYAHKKGVIHRDVKPGNVLISKTGEIKISDFGLARGMGVATAERIGSSGYMSPEQEEGGVVEYRSDIYALGAMLYHLLAGERPTRMRLEKVPESIRDVIDRATAGMEERHESVREFREALECAAGAAHGAAKGEPAAARPAASPEAPCSGCGKENPPQARFCEKCGAGLFEPCPKCKREIRTGTKHCMGCGLNVSVWREVQECLARAKQCREAGEFGRAEAEYQRAIALDPESEEAQRGRKEVADLQARRARARSQAASLEKEERYEEAEKTYREVLALNPKDEEALRAMKVLPEKRQARDVRRRKEEAARLESAAEAAFRELERAAGSSAAARRAKAEAAHGDGDYAKVIDLARRALALDPDLKAAREIAAKAEAARQAELAGQAALRELECAAEAAHGQGDFEKAKTLWGQILSKAPGDAKAKEGLRRAEEAKAALDALMKEAAEQSQRKEWRTVIETCGRIETLRKGRPEASAIRQVAEAEIAKAEKLACAAGAAHGARRYEEAIAQTKETLEIDPAHPGAGRIRSEAETALKMLEEQRKIGEARLGERRYAEAIEAFGRALALRPDPALSARLEEARRGRSRSRRKKALAVTAVLALLAAAWTGQAAFANRSGMQAARQHIVGREFQKALDALEGVGSFAVNLDEKSGLDKQARIGLLLGTAREQGARGKWLEAFSTLKEARRLFGPGPELAPFFPEATEVEKALKEAAFAEVEAFRKKPDFASGAAFLATLKDVLKDDADLFHASTAFRKDAFETLSAAAQEKTREGPETVLPEVWDEAIRDYKQAALYTDASAQLDRIAEAQAGKALSEGYVALKGSDPDKAERKVAEAEVIDPGIAAAKTLREAVAECRKELAAAREHRYQAAIDETQQLIQAKEWDKALAAVKRAIEEKPDEKALGLRREIEAEVERERSYHTAVTDAERQINEKDLDNAMISVNTALKAKTDDEKALGLKREIEQAKAKYAEAVKRAEECIKAKDWPGGATAVSDALAIWPRKGEADGLLRYIEDAKRVPALVDALENSKRIPEKVAAAVALGNIGSHARDAVPALARVLRIRDNYVDNSVYVLLRNDNDLPLTIVRTLGEIGKEASSAASAVEWFRWNMESWAEHDAMAGDKCREAMKAAESTLKGMGPAEESALIADLKDKDWGMRWGAARVLGLQTESSKTVVAALVDAIEDDKDIRVRIAAAESLGNIGPPARDAVPALAKALRIRDNYVDNSVYVLLRNDNDLPLTIVRTLGEIGKEASSAASAVEWFRWNMESWA
ncbi:MAG: protein kinase, partial [Planctomycetes bacterium]|nr:protein kinase [Planctomycetota bacterium]